MIMSMRYGCLELNLSEFLRSNSFIGGTVASRYHTSTYSDDYARAVETYYEWLVCIKMRFALSSLLAASFNALKSEKNSVQKQTALLKFNLFRRGNNELIAQSVRPVSRYIVHIRILRQRLHDRHIYIRHIKWMFYGQDKYDSVYHIHKYKKCIQSKNHCRSPVFIFHGNPRRPIRFRPHCACCARREWTVPHNMCYNIRSMAWCHTIFSC